MSRFRISIISSLLFCLLVPLSPGGLAGQVTATLSGQVIVPLQSQAAIPLLTVRLYAPLEMKKPVLLSYLDSAGRFKFETLAVGNYLIEVYQGDKVLYQQEVAVTGKPLLITLGTPPLEKATIPQRYAVALNGPEFRGNIIIHVGEIDPPKPFTMLIFQIKPRESTGKYMTIQSSESLRKKVSDANVLFFDSLSLPDFATTFQYNGKTYNLIGRLKKAKGNESVYCEIYQ